jgi:hypothetical protein
MWTVGRCVTVPRTVICQVKTLTQACARSGHSGARGKHYGARGFYLKLGLKIRWLQGRAGLSQALAPHKYPSKSVEVHSIIENTGFFVVHLRHAQCIAVKLQADVSLSWMNATLATQTIKKS